MLDQILTIAFCLVLPTIGMLGLGLVAARARIKMVGKLNRLKAQGKYEEWVNRNRVVVFLERTHVAVFSASFLGFVVASLLNVQFARFLFGVFAISGIGLPITSFLFYRSVMREDNNPTCEPPVHP